MVVEDGNYLFGGDRLVFQWSEMVKTKKGQCNLVILQVLSLFTELSTLFSRRGSVMYIYASCSH